MAVISPWTGAGDAVAQQVRQRVVDQLTFAQKQQDMDLAQRRQAMLEQEAQQRAEEHQANMASLAEQRSAGVAKENEQRVNLITGRLSIGQNLKAPDAESLPSYLTAPQGVTPPAAPASIAEGDQAAELPGTVANSPSIQARNFRYIGTPAQQDVQQQKQIRGRILSDPNLTPQQRLAIEAEGAGLKVPANVWEQKPSNTIDGSYTLNGRPIVGLKTNGRVMYRGQDVTDQVTPFTPPQQSIVIQTPTGPALVNRGSGTATPIKDGEGNDVGPKTKNVAERLGTTAQQLADMDTALQEAHRLSDILKKSGLDKDNSPFGPRTATILASHGISPGDLPGDITQASKFTKAELMLGLARGSGIRGQQLQQELGAHLPDSIQTGKQLADVLNFVDREYQNKRHNTLRAHGVKDEEYPFEDVYRPQKDNAATGTVQVGGFTVKVKP